LTDTLLKKGKSHLPCFRAIFTQILTEICIKGADFDQKTHIVPEKNICRFLAILLFIVKYGNKWIL
jgi:hypothetical protein